MKRLAVVLCLFAALHATPAEAACDPNVMYQTVKAAVLEREPWTQAEFDGVMSEIGLTQDGHVWKCENSEGALLAVLIAGKHFINLNYTPIKSEKVPEALLSILAARAHAEPVGPHWISFEYRSDEKAVAAYGSADEFTETITVDLLGGIWQGTECTIRPKVKAKR